MVPKKMSKMKSFITIRPANLSMSEAHNERRVKLHYLLPGREGRTDHWKQEPISTRLNSIRAIYREKVGQTMQPNASPVREAVIACKQDTQIFHLSKVAEALRKRFGIDCFQIHIHRDEGHIGSDGNAVMNYHAHMIFDWQDKNTGRSIKLNKSDMSEMQTLVANELGMERGQIGNQVRHLRPKQWKELQRMKHEAQNASEAAALRALTVREKLLEIFEEKLSRFHRGDLLAYLRSEVHESVQLRQGKDGSRWFALNVHDPATGAPERGVVRLKDLSAAAAKRVVESIQQQEENKDYRVSGSEDLIFRIR